MKLHITEIFTLLRDKKFPVPATEIYFDRVYQLPTVDWVADRFTPWYQHHRMLPYVHEKWDCDDIALDVMVQARRLHATTPDAEMAGMPCGMMRYTPIEKHHPIVKYTVGRTDHAVNFWIVNRDGKADVLFFEGQIPGPTHITSDEINTIFDRML